MLASISEGFRWAVLAEASLLVGFVSAILVEAKKFRAPPRHVIGVAISYMIIVVAYAVELGRHLTAPFTYRIVVGAVSFGFGLWSMWSMYTHYRYVERVKRHAAQGEEAAIKLLEREMARRTSGLS